MADIFISYARADRQAAERLAHALKGHGWSVWWDRNVPSGAEFSAEIERELRAAGAVIVCWSADGVKSSWVRDEAMLAKRENKLRTISLDGTEPPIGFMQYHVHDMSGWDGDPDHPDFVKMAADLGAALSPGAGNGASVAERASADEVRKKPAADGADPPRSRASRVLAYSLALVAALAAGAWYLSRSADEGEQGGLAETTGPAVEVSEARGGEMDTPTAGDTASIVVLPFESRSPKPEDLYFSVGVSEQILNGLSGVEGLRVVARATAFGFRGQGRSIGEIAEVLGVTYVLEGSVWRSGERVRITAQLVDAERGFNVWSNSYDRASVDLFAVQDDIARSIVDELPLGMMDAVAATVSGETDVDAYDLYLLARQKWATNTYESHEEVTGLLDRALERSPAFVEALALRAIVEISLSDVFFGADVHPLGEALPRAKRWIDEARRLDADAPESLHAWGLYHHAQSELPTAQASYRDALRARPNYTSARNNYALTLLMEGRGREAVAELEEALRFDPAHVSANQTLFDQYILLHELEKAEESLDRWEQVDPDQRAIAFQRARWLRFAGRVAESLEALDALADAKPDVPVQCSQLYAEVLLRLAEYERVVEEFAACDGGAAWTSRGLTLQGRHEEAVEAAEAWRDADPDGPWPVDALLRSLYYAGRWSDYVETLERNFHYAPVFRDTKTQPVGSPAAGPYRHAGHSRAGQIVEGVYEFVEASDARYPEIDIYLSRVLVLDGREDEAMARLQSAIEKTYFTPWTPIDPVLGKLSGREDYEALVAEIERQVNAERAKLELPPVALKRAVTKIAAAPARSPKMNREPSSAKF